MVVRDGSVLWRPRGPGGEPTHAAHGVSSLSEGRRRSPLAATAEGKATGRLWALDPALSDWLAADLPYAVEVLRPGSEGH